MDVTTPLTQLPVLWKSFFDYSFDNPWFFTNYSFLLTLGVFLMLYALLLPQNLLRKLYLIVFSLFFYYKSSGPFLLIFVLLIFADYHFAILIDRVVHQRLRKFLMALSILISLSFLLYFKYSGFLTETINDLFHSHFEIHKLFLPIGISFYTFQSISYIVDVYQKKIPSSRSFIDYAFYMTFFPHLVAGPIVRAKDFIPQINEPQIVNRDIMKKALFRVVLGLTKKLLIADFLARYVDMVHTDPTMYSGFENLMSMYAYACQIYFDFSGYSDIAIGIALLMGYELKENFNNPYKARNITEFWRRWHISLSSWLRDYIYIPLGGNRKGAFNMYLFLMITMTIGGFWHGASWNFVWWGIAHGFALVIHKLFFSKDNNSSISKPNILWTILSTFFTFHFVSLLWILFRAENSTKAINSIKKIGSEYRVEDIVGFYLSRPEVCGMLLLGFIIIFLHRSVKPFAERLFLRMPIALLIAFLVVFFQIILQLRNTEIAPFIYFQF